MQKNIIMEIAFRTTETGWERKSRYKNNFFKLKLLFAYEFITKKRSKNNIATLCVHITHLLLLFSNMKTANDHYFNYYFISDQSQKQIFDSTNIFKHVINFFLHACLNNRNRWWNDDIHHSQLLKTFFFRFRLFMIASFWYFSAFKMDIIQ